MSEVNAADRTEIKSTDDIIGLYAGSGDQAKAGIEVELAFFDAQQPDQPPMSLARNAELKEAALGAMTGDDWVHNEPTSELLEVASVADSFTNMKTVLDDTNHKIQLLTKTALEQGLKRSYFQELPERTADDLLSRIVDVERYQVMYAPYREDMTKCVQYFAVCKSNQVSISPYNMDHMLENVRRLYILAPFLFLLTDNSSGFNEGKPFANHIGMSMRHEGLDQGRGGVPPYVFAAASGEELIANHIDHVFNNPLFMYYDLDGNLIKVPSGDWTVTFNALREKGLNTASNYNLAQSLLWPDVKIAGLRDKDGAVYGHRYEARMFGVGIHQHQSAFIITSMLAFHADFAAAVDELLARYGFGNDDLPETYNLTMHAYDYARNHGGKFFNIRYGSGSMKAFAKEFADILDRYIDDVNLRKEAQPIMTICKSGCTDGKVNRSLFPTLQDILDQQKNYDPEIFTDPSRCAHDIYSDRISEMADSLCDAA